MSRCLLCSPKDVFMIKADKDSYVNLPQSMSASFNQNFCLMTKHIIRICIFMSHFVCLCCIMTSHEVTLLVGVLETILTSIFEPRTRPLIQRIRDHTATHVPVFLSVKSPSVMCCILIHEPMLVSMGFTTPLHEGLPSREHT